MSKTPEARRICFVNSTRFWGGGEKWHFDTAVYLSGKGHRVWCAAHPRGELFRRLAPTAVERHPLALTNASFLNPVKILKLALFFRFNRIDTAVFNGSVEMKLAAVAAAAAGVPARVYRRGMALPVKAGAVNRLMFSRMVTHFLASSHLTADTLFRHLPRPGRPGSVRVIYNGVDVDRFAPGAEIRKPAAGPRPVVLGTAGRLVDQKGHVYLIDMAAALKADNLPFRLLIAGDGPLMPVLRRRIEQRGVGNEVSLLGFVTDTAAFLQRLDVFVLPSLWEGLANAAVEAMAAALPVVAFDLTSNPEIVEDGRTGFLVAPRQAGALAAAVAALAGDPALRRRMGGAGRRRAIEQFDRDRQRQKLEAYLCREVLQRPGS